MKKLAILAMLSLMLVLSANASADVSGIRTSWFSTINVTPVAYDSLASTQAKLQHKADFVYIRPNAAESTNYTAITLYDNAITSAYANSCTQAKQKLNAMLENLSQYKGDYRINSQATDSNDNQICQLETKKKLITYENCGKKVKANPLGEQFGATNWIFKGKCYNTKTIWVKA